MLRNLALSTLENAHIRGTLITSEHTIVNCYRRLTLPDFEFEVDALNSQLRFLWVGEVSADEASSITDVAVPGWTISTESLRTFAHDFTFSILAQETDERLDTIHRLGDANDELTPDAIIHDEQVLAVFEFTTTKNAANMAQAYRAKLHKYRNPLAERVRARRDYAKIYSYSPLVVSAESLAYPDHIAMPQALVDELIARFVFANRIIDEAINLGVDIGDDSYSQALNDMKAALLAYPRTVGEHQINDTQITYSRRLIDTDDVDPKVAIEYTSALYHTCLRKSLRDVPTMDKTVDLAAEEAKYNESFLGTATHQKAIIQLPGIIPAEKQLGEFELSMSDALMAKVWDATIQAEKMGEINLAELTEDEMEKLALEQSEEPDKEMHNAIRSRYHRVEIILDDADEVELAKIGVCGKSKRNDESVKDYREQKKVGFSLDVDTTDLDDWLNQPANAEPLDLTGSSFSILSLINEALACHNYQRTSVLTLTRTHLASPLHQIMEMISDIGTELSISLRQSTKKRMYIYKKLKNFGLHMLIKPTKSDSHIFVSFMIPVEDGIEVIPQGVSKRFVNYGSYLATDFVSFNVSKLVNLVKAESHSIILLHHFRKFYKLHHKHDVPANSRLWFMWKLCMLASLEDKHRTEEAFTLFRYISMEKFSLSSANPGKMFAKLPNNSRSRLESWVIRKLITEIKGPLYHYNKRRGDRTLWGWQHMRNPYNGEVITDPNDLVELYYIGYIKNKDEVSSANVDFALIVKIIKYEKELYNAEPALLGYESPRLKLPADLMETKEDLIQEDLAEEVPEFVNPEPLKVHEFSRHCVCAASDALSMHWRSIYGKNYQDTVSKGILERFKRVTWEQIATLKASSQFDPHDAPSGKQRTQRMKVIIALLRNEGMIKNTPFESLYDIMKWVDEDGGLRVDLFKKNQHGGLREIYVLELHSRVLQLFLEEISRFICTTIPAEMMMHPSSKIRRPQEHIIRAGLRKEHYNLSCYSSNDAAVWNQGHFVPKFQMFLIRCLPREFHGLIDIGMLQWTRKRMKLPDGVFNLLHFNPDVKFHKDEETSVANAYRGVEDVPWMKENANHVNIASGMMQGILHYTSSAFHGAVLLLRDNIYRKTMCQLGYKVQTTDLVSSDDSSRLTDVFGTTEEECKQALVFARADHLLMNIFSTYFGIQMSVKSTMCTNNVVEFNSEFYFKASLARPTIKWSFAGINITEVESLYERQEVMYNLMTELLEGGSGFMLAHALQVAQAFLHYRLIGSSVNNLWFRFVNHLTRCKDPSLGFFLMAHPLSCGLLGLQYDLWKNTRNSVDFSRRLANSLRTGQHTSTSSGTLMGGVQIRFGNRKKVMRLLEEAEEVMPNWRDHIDEDPSVLYLIAKDKQQALIRIMVKLTAPTVTASLSKGNTISRMIASSVYIISHNATSLGSSWIDTLEKEKLLTKSSRTSLYRLAVREETCEPLTHVEQQALFPLTRSYEDAELLLEVLAQDVLIPTPHSKKLRSKIVVYPHVTETAFSLEKICRAVWFDQRLPTSHRVVQWTWNHYRELYPWLSEDINQSLADSPFENHISMRNFIARQTERGRVVHLTGSPVKTARGTDQLLNAIVMNQWPGYKLSRVAEEDNGLRDDPTHYNSTIVTDVGAILMFPFTDVKQSSEIESYLSQAEDIWDGSIIRPNPRMQRLAMIQEACKQKTGRSTHSPAHLGSMMAIAKSGCLGGWSKRQKLIGEKWTGKGIWLGFVGGTKVRLEMQDGELLSIHTNSIEWLRKDRHLLKNLLDELQLTTEMNVFRYSPTGWRWTGFSFSREGNGAPVIETSIQVANEFDPKDFFIFASSGMISLVWKVDRASISVCSYRVAPSDFNWGVRTGIKKMNSMFRHFRHGIPLEPKVAETYLNSFMTKTLKRESGMDLDKLKKFVATTFRTSLAKFGFMTLLSDVYNRFKIEDPVDNDYSDLLDDFLMDEVVGGGTLMFLGGAVKEAMSPEPDTESENGSASVVSGDLEDVIEYGAETGAALLDNLDFSMVARYQAPIEFLAGHSLFDRLADMWRQRVRKEGAQLISAGKYNSATENIADVISYYTGIEFQPADDDALSDILEVDDMFEEDDD